MPSYLEQLAQRNYNPDGTMKPEYRERLRSWGICETEINQREVRHIRKARNAQQVQELREEHEQRCDRAEQDWKQEYQQRHEERVRLAVVSNSSVKAVDLSAMSLEERYAFEMAGLDHEELMSQGFMEPDHFYNAVEVPPMSDREDKQECYVFSASALAADEEF